MERKNDFYLKSFPKLPIPSIASNRARTRKKVLQLRSMGNAWRNAGRSFEELPHETLHSRLHLRRTGVRHHIHGHASDWYVSVLSHYIHISPLDVMG